MKKTTVVFDMGGVLTESLDLFIDRFAINKEEAGFLRGSLLKSVEWVMLDRGTLTEDEIVDIFKKRYPEYDEKRIESFVYDFLMENDTPAEMIDLIRELKQNNIHCYLMSNVGVGYPKFEKRLSSLALLDGHWCSYHHKLIKPEPEAFQSLFKMFDLNPEECFFIDDAPLNIEQANRQGMEGFLYRQNINELKEVLRKEGFILHE